jgi:hypothetical protein
MNVDSVEISVYWLYEYDIDVITEEIKPEIRVTVDLKFEINISTSAIFEERRVSWLT